MPIPARTSGIWIVLNSGVADTDGVGTQTLNGTISANAGNGIVTINLNQEGAATDGTDGTITSSELLLLSNTSTAASFTFDNDGHDVDQLAANTSGAISFRDDDGLAIDTVLLTNGIATGNGVASGAAVLIESSNSPSGTITVNHAVTTATGAGGGISISGSVVVNAAVTAEGGNVTLNGANVGAFDLDINFPLVSSASMTLTAPRDILVGALVQTTGATSDITLTADSEAVPDGIGGVRVEALGQVDSAHDATLEGSDLFADGRWRRESVQIDDGGAGVDQVLAVRDITIRSRANAPANADIEIFGQIRSAGLAAVNITIDAKEDVLFGVNGDIMAASATSGLIHVFADQATAGSTGGVITMADGTLLSVGASTVEIVADGNLQIGEIVSTGGVNAASLAASITDADAGAGNDITAGSLALWAASGDRVGRGRHRDDDSVAGRANRQRRHSCRQLGIADGNVRRTHHKLCHGDHSSGLTAVRRVDCRPLWHFGFRPRQYHTDGQQSADRE